MVQSFVFGRFSVHVGRRELLSDGAAIELGSRAFDILMLLIEARGELVSKADLMRRVWGNIIVEESTLQSHIWALRNALKEERNRILTVSRRGYRFVGQCQAIEGSEISVQDARDSRHCDHSSGPVLISRARTNLPSMMSPLIGRSGKVAELVDVIDQRRLVTLTGVGGVGKTRMALEVAHRILPHFPDGVWVTELASLSDPHSITNAVVAALGLQIGTTELSAVRLGATFGSRHCLLVLDNCEHLLDAVANFTEDLLRATPALHIVVTSREPLGIEGEQVYQVPPLDSPPEQVKGASEVLAYDAAQFFCTRTREADYTFSLDDVNAGAVAAICRCLDGLPLALELAAARAAALGATTVATRLDRLFDLLTQGRRTSPARHRTLRATLEWSYELLSEAERRVLCRLSVFSGGFTLEAACALAGDSAAATITAVTDCVARLLVKSFIAADRKEVPVRYRLLQTTRVYLLERLTESNEIEVYRRRHAEYFRDVLITAESSSLVSREGRQTSEIENLRAALTWAFSERGDPLLGIELAIRSAPLWFGMSLLNECRSWIEKAVAQLGACGATGTHDEVILRSTLALTLTIQGATGSTIRAALADACELAQTLNERNWYLNVLFSKWCVGHRAADALAMSTVAKRMQAVAAEMGGETLTAFAEGVFALTEHYSGNYTGARLHFERAIGVVGDLPGSAPPAQIVFDNRASALCSLAHVLWVQGFPDQAVETAERSLHEARVGGKAITLCHSLMHRIWLALQVEDLEAADRYSADLMTRADEMSSDVYHAYALAAQGVLSAKHRGNASGLTLMQAAMSQFHKVEHVYFRTRLGGEVAEVLGKLGRLEEGQAVLDESLAQARRGGVYVLFSEWLRIKGELYSLAGDADSIQAAETTFVESIDWSHRRGALSLELRASMSLARLKQNQGRYGKAVELLAPVYVRFQEGFATKDLQTAKVLLDQLGWPACTHPDRTNDAVAIPNSGATADSCSSESFQTETGRCRLS